MIDRFKEKAGSALQLTSLAAAIAVAGLVTLAFLCAAGFVYVLQTYGPIQACLTCAGIFLLVAVIAAGLFVARRNRRSGGARGGSREIRGPRRAGRSDAGRRRPPGDPRHRRQEADPDTGGRRLGAGIAGQPPRFRGRSAGGVTRRAAMLSQIQLSNSQSTSLRAQHQTSLRALAKQSSRAGREAGLLRRFRLRSLSYGGQVAPRNDGKTHLRILAARFARVLPVTSRPLKSEGAGNAGRPMRPIAACAR